MSWFISLGGLLIFNQAAALEMSILAEFKPDPANPQHNTFENLTPTTGAIALHRPTVCAAIKSLKIKTYFSSINPQLPIILILDKGPW